MVGQQSWLAFVGPIIVSEGSRGLHNINRNNAVNMKLCGSSVVLTSCGVSIFWGVIPGGRRLHSMVSSHEFYLTCPGWGSVMSFCCNGNMSYGFCVFILLINFISFCF